VYEFISENSSNNNIPVTIMNPITNAKNLKKLSDREIEMGIAGSSASWHNMYKDSAWIFVGGLDYELTEGDIIAVFSQYGEIVNINLVREKNTGKSKGFAFICYEDQRSTILAVDNLNTITLCKRIIRVDHVEQYKVPKMTDDMDEETIKLRDEGCAPIPQPVTNVRVKQDVKQEVKREKSDTDRKRRSRSKDRKDRKRDESSENKSKSRHRHSDHHEKKEKRHRSRSRSRDRSDRRHNRR
jgi:RNA-binding motif X-linked protein 2